MTITRSEFENKKKEKGMKKEILNLLNNDKANGYDAKEVLDHLTNNFNDMYWYEKLTSFGAEKNVEYTLDELVKSGMISSNPVTIGDHIINYYIAKKE